MDITNYESLLSAAKMQTEPQRLLFVFLKVHQPKDHKSEESNLKPEQGGELEPIMCADKTLDELGSFADLVTESESMEKAWQMVLVAGLSGKNGVAPTSDDATQPLKMMVETVEKGGDLSGFIAFDKSGIPIQFGD